MHVVGSLGPFALAAVAALASAGVGVACAPPPGPDAGAPRPDDDDDDDDDDDTGEGEGEGEPVDAGVVPPGVVHPALSTVRAAPAFPLPADGAARFAIDVTVVDGAGAPMPGVVVTLAVDAPAGVLIAQPPPTDAQGTAVGTIASAVEGTLFVAATATAGGSDVVLAAQPAIEFAGCLPVADYLEREVWGPVLSRCAGCHNHFGLARSKGIDYRLALPGEPGFPDANVAVLRDYAGVEIEVGGGSAYEPILLAKPLLHADEGHEGGAVLADGSDEAQRLAALVWRLQNDDACPAPPVDDLFADVVLRTPKQTYEAAQRALTGAPPTEAALAVFVDTDDGLDAALDAALATDAFGARLMEIWNDVLLTDAYKGGNRGLNRLPRGDFPRRSYFERCDVPLGGLCCNVDGGAAGCCVDDGRDPDFCAAGKANDGASVAREALQHVRFTVANDEPFTRALTRGAALVNPYTAHLYGVHELATFDADPTNDADEWVEVALVDTPYNAVRSATGGLPPGVPHAGLLTTAALLSRFPTTESNYQRTRAARVILERFLAVPVMKLADFVVTDAAAQSALENATQTQMPCVVCHTAIDRVAGNFDHFAGGSFTYRPNRQWSEDLPPPGFLDVDAPADRHRVQWLAEQVVAHPRFGYAVAKTMFQALVGAVPDPPAAPTDDDYAARRRAFVAVNDYLTALGARFLAPAATGGYDADLKALIKDVVRSPFFRAHGLAAPVDDETAAALAFAGAGLGRVLTNEQLHRRVLAVTGIPWRKDLVVTGRDLLLSPTDDAILWGGIDSQSVTTRFRDPFPVMANVARRMAVETSCVLVPQEFATTDASQRRFLRSVSTTTDPTTTDGAAAIKLDLARAHRLVLGEELAVDDLEVAATFALFLDTWTRGQGASASLPSKCQATKDWHDPDAGYPRAGKVAVTNDPTHAIRAWMAVFTYLLSDARFLVE